MKPREARRSVLISARLRQGCIWADAQILNISSRGLMVQAPDAPPRGTYVEICRGSYRIVARVVWSRTERFGVCSQDLLPVDSIARDLPPPAAKAQDCGADRRLRARPAQSSADRHDRSRRRARAAEFLCVTALGAGAAVLAFDTVERILSNPLEQVSASLAGKS